MGKLDRSEEVGSLVRRFSATAQEFERDAKALGLVMLSKLIGAAIREAELIERRNPPPLGPKLTLLDGRPDDRS